MKIKRQGPITIYAIGNTSYFLKKLKSRGYIFLELSSASVTGYGLTPREALINYRARINRSKAFMVARRLHDR